MGKTHDTKHFRDPDTGEKIEESGKEISVKNIILVRTVRDAVFAILQGKDGVDIKQYLVKSKPVKLNHSPKKLPKKTREEYLEFPKDDKAISPIDNTKNKIHSALMLVGINGSNTDKRIKTAMHTVADQYKNMDAKRLLHRMRTTRFVDNEKINKLERDVRFVLGVSKFFGPQGYEGMKFAMDGFFGKEKLPGLTEKSHSLYALNHIIQAGRDNLSELEFETFKKIMYQALNTYKTR